MRVDADYSAVKGLLKAVKASYVQLKDTDAPDMQAAIREISQAGIGFEEDAVNIYGEIIKLFSDDFYKATERLMKYADFLLGD